MDQVKLPGKRELKSVLRKTCPLGELEPLWEVFAQTACKVLSQTQLQMCWIVAVDQFCWASKRPDWYRADLQAKFDVIWEALSTIDKQHR